MLTPNSTSRFGRKNAEGSVQRLLVDLGRSAALSGLLAAPVLASFLQAPPAAARMPAAPELAPINQLDLQVNTYTTSAQTRPKLAHDAAGNMVVVWQSSGSSGTGTDLASVQLKHLDPVAEFQVNTYTTSHQRVSDIAVDANGNYVMTWASFGSDGTDTVFWSIQGQRYDSFGIPTGQQFQVNTYTDHIQHQPAVAMDADGDFVIAWHSMGSAGTDSDTYSIQGQRFNSLGIAQGSEFQVNTLGLTQNDEIMVR